MATDYILTLDGIRGESQIINHNRLGTVSQSTGSSSHSHGGGGGTGKVSYSDLGVMVSMAPVVDVLFANYR